MSKGSNKKKSKQQKKKKSGKSGTTECEDPKHYGARVHAQGTDCGGTTGSTIGTSMDQSTPVTIAQGLGLSDATWGKLTKSQKRPREAAKVKADNFISTCGGFLGKKTFDASDRSGGKRYDVDTFGDGPSFVS